MFKPTERQQKVLSRSIVTEESTGYIETQDS